MVLWLFLCRFGWLTVGQCHIPYITRDRERYCAVRMVETKLLKKYPTAFHQDIYRYIELKCFVGVGTLVFLFQVCLRP